MLTRRQTSWLASAKPSRSFGRRLRAEGLEVRAMLSADGLGVGPVLETPVGTQECVQAADCEQLQAQDRSQVQDGTCQTPTQEAVRTRVLAPSAAKMQAKLMQKQMSHQQTQSPVQAPQANSGIESPVQAGDQTQTQQQSKDQLQDGTCLQDQLLAQDRLQSQDGTCDQDQVQQQDRLQDGSCGDCPIGDGSQDQDQDRVQDQTRLQDGTCDQDRDRDQTNAQDKDQLRLQAMDCVFSSLVSA